MKKILVLILVLGLVASACDSGSTSGDRKEASSADIFVDTDQNAGTIDLVLNDSSLEISETSGFHVTVKDSLGRGVPNIRILCDTENGVAIIEPNTGSELTNSSGSMSGMIGCAAAGSFQMACRLPIGANKRKFVQVKCSGTLPDGFIGFPGAAGGGLGGGVVETGDDESIARITGVTYDDAGTAGDYAIDISQVYCNNNTPTKADDDFWENFYDVLIHIKVINSSSSPIRFERFKYKIRDFRSNGEDFESDVLSLLADFEVAQGGGTGTLSGLFARPDATGKVLNGDSSVITAVGFYDVEVTLYGTNLLDENIVLKATTSTSFNHYDACGGAS